MKLAEFPQFISIICKHPFSKEGANVGDVYCSNEMQCINIVKTISIDTSQDVINKLEMGSVVIEMYRAGTGLLLGLAIVPLKPFCTAFAIIGEHGALKYVRDQSSDPMIGFKGAIVLSHPITNLFASDCEITLALGSENQISNHLSSELSVTKPKQNQQQNNNKLDTLKDDNHEEDDSEELLQNSPIKHNIKSDTGNFSTQPMIKSKMNQEEQMKPVPSKTIPSSPLKNKAAVAEPNLADSFDDPVALVQKLNPTAVQQHHEFSDDDEDFERILKPVEKKPTPIIEHSLPEFPMQSQLRIRIIRATGLQGAAIHACKKVPALQKSCELGINPFVEFHVLPDDSHESNQNQTPVLAKTFTPVWNFEKTIFFEMSRELFLHFADNSMILNFFHRFSKVDAMAFKLDSNNLKIGESAIVLAPLVSPDPVKSIHTWFNIYSTDSVTVGAVQVELMFDEATRNAIAKLKESIPVSPLKSPNSKENIVVVKKSDVSALPYGVCRFTVMIEEVLIPQAIIHEKAPSYIKAHSPIFACYYYLQYQFYQRGTTF